MNLLICMQLAVSNKLFKKKKNTELYTNKYTITLRSYNVTYSVAKHAFFWFVYLKMLNKRKLGAAFQKKNMPVLSNQ